MRIGKLDCHSVQGVLEVDNNVTRIDSGLNLSVLLSRVHTIVSHCGRNSESAARYNIVMDMMQPNTMTASQSCARLGIPAKALVSHSPRPCETWAKIDFGGKAKIDFGGKPSKYLQ